MENTTVIPTDLFSRTLREKQDNPAALRATSTVHTADFYGNAEAWIVDTYRTEDGRETVFLQRSAADGGMRLVLLPDVTAAMARQRDQLTAKSRKRGARRALETKRMNGVPLGNPAALARARRRRGKKR